MKYCTILAAALLFLNVFTARADEQGIGFEIGIAPFLPVKTLVQNYAPMRDYLQSRLHEPVTIVSAPDYKTYYQRIQNREYPIIIAAANSAYLAWAESAYIPMLQPLIPTRPVLIVAKDSQVNKLSDLRGKTVSMSDTLAIVSMQGIKMLRDAGLKAGRDVTVNNMPNQSVAVNFVISRDVAAAIVSDRAIMQMPLSVRKQVKIIYTWEQGAAPGIIYLASPNMPPDRVKKISQAILEYARDVAEGKELMQSWGYGGLVPVSAADLRRLEPYGKLLKEELSKVR
jgi:phosphonate transport system substrate-binding protein